LFRPAKSQGFRNQRSDGASRGQSRVRAATCAGRGGCPPMFIFVDVCLRREGGPSERQAAARPCLDFAEGRSRSSARRRAAALLHGTGRQAWRSMIEKRRLGPAAAVADADLGRVSGRQRLLVEAALVRAAFRAGGLVLAEVSAVGAEAEGLAVSALERHRQAAQEAAD